MPALNCHRRGVYMYIVSPPGAIRCLVHIREVRINCLSERIADGFLHKKGSPYSTTERRVPELIPVLGSQPAGDVSHKPGGRLPLLSARPAVTFATLKRAATNFAAW